MRPLMEPHAPRRNTGITAQDDKDHGQNHARHDGQFLARRLSDRVFHDVFPRLVRAIAAAVPAEPLSDLREAALVLLYRLMFMLWARDRDLSRPARGGGDGEPCGGLFDMQRALLLTEISLDNGAIADVIDALSFEQTPAGRASIDYGALSVQQLGGIYERLLALELVRDGAGVLVRPDIFARRTSGSYYTPDELVALVIRETVGPLADERMAAFRAAASSGGSPGVLQGLDPASRLLDLKICDPAMGAGHFLVSLVDDLADRIIVAMQEAEAPLERGRPARPCPCEDRKDAGGTPALPEAYVSPLRARIAAVRSAIARAAGGRGAASDPARLDDRHIVRRIVAAQCIYGVDKNPMAVELAKAALQLHTFTPGAPPVFLDHHLRCGDSLFGLSVRKGTDRVAELGAPFLLQGPVVRAMGAADTMHAIDELNDAGIAEARRPVALFAAAQEATAPLDALLSLLHAFDWLDLCEDDKGALRAFVQGQFGDPVHLAVGTADLPPAGRFGFGADKCDSLPPCGGGMGWGVVQWGTAVPHLATPTPIPSPQGGGDEFVKAADLQSEAARLAGLLRRSRQLIAEERFFNWQVAFPGVWTDWETKTPSLGFDAIIGNPPWDRMKLQQVEWFAARRRDIAMAARAADRARMIAALETSGDPLAQDYARASARAEAAARMARTSGDYPLLSGGDINLYSLFVERAMALVRPGGLVGLLTPSGIASDKTAARFFKGVATHGRLRALYDFENRRTRFGEEPFFPDVDSRFKFCVFIASPTPLPMPARCGFFLQDVSELADAQRCFALTAEDFARVNPNTGTAPVFRSRRDADLTTAIYGRLPVLVDRSTGAKVRFADAANASPRPCGEGMGVGVGRRGTEVPYCITPHSIPPPQGGKESRGAMPDSTFGLPGTGPAATQRELRAWPVRYMTMFHMTNDSHLFRTKAELVEKEKAHPVGGNRWQSPKGIWLPLYEGKMAQAFDHRAASVVVNAKNRHRPAQPEPTTAAQHQDPAWLPEPQYWVEASHCGWSPSEKWVLGFKEITAPTNERTFIAALFPVAAFGNKIPLLRPTGACRREHLLCANLNSIVFDFIVRQKVQGQTLNRFIVEQLPVVPPDHYDRRFGPITAAQIVTNAVLELTYTSHDMAPFAADMGFTDRTGGVRPPFAWDDARHLMLRAKLDAVFFRLYAVTGRDDIRYIYSTFPILERKETARHGRYLTRDLCLAWMDTLGAGEPEADVFSSGCVSRDSCY